MERKGIVRSEPPPSHCAVPLASPATELIVHTLVASLPGELFGIGSSGPKTHLVMQVSAAGQSLSSTQVALVVVLHVRPLVQWRAGVPIIPARSAEVVGPQTSAPRPGSPLGPPG